MKAAEVIDQQDDSRNIDRPGGGIVNPVFNTRTFAGFGGMTEMENVMSIRGVAEPYRMTNSHR